jgi:hypothetical protein
MRVLLALNCCDGTSKLENPGHTKRAGGGLRLSGRSALVSAAFYAACLLPACAIRRLFAVDRTRTAQYWCLEDYLPYKVSCGMSHQTAIPS